jgi:thiol-disulfide isomerase/thioredoxin
MRNFLAAGLLLGLTVGVSRAERGAYGTAAPEFPPGVFSDGGHYSVEDFRGKLLVLYFYENSCPSCRGLVPTRNKLVASYKDKPVKFIAIGPHDTLGEVKAYTQGTGLVMPVFADPMGVMQKRYGFSISLQDIYQFRIINPEGVVVSYLADEKSIDRALETVKWKFKDAGYHAKLAAAVDAFEWNRWVVGMKLLKPQLTSTDKEVKASAEKLYGEIKKLGEEWKEEAGKSAESEPVKAYDLYTRVATVFEGEDLGKSVANDLAKLKTNKVVALELEGRKAYGQLEQALTKASAAQKDDVVKFCTGFVKKYEGTPVAARVQSYLDDLK